MTHQEFAQAVMAEWNLVPGQMAQSCYCQWYNYTAEIDGKRHIVGEYTLRDWRALFIVYRRDGSESVYDAG